MYMVVHIYQRIRRITHRLHILFSPPWQRQYGKVWCSWWDSCRYNLMWRSSWCYGSVQVGGLVIPVLSVANRDELILKFYSRYIMTLRTRRQHPEPSDGEGTLASEERGGNGVLPLWEKEKQGRERIGGDGEGQVKLDAGWAGKESRKGLRNEWGVCSRRSDWKKKNTDERMII